MPRNRAPHATLDDATQREEIAQLRLQVERLTQQLAALQPPTASDSDTEDNANPYAYRHGIDRRWEAGFKVDIPEFHGNLHADELIDWLHTVEEILDFKEGRIIAVFL